MPAFLYFAYGANLHPLRLRAIAPSCEVVGTAVLGGHALRFHKRSRDGSGKCDASPDAAATVHGVVYRVDAADRPSLDRAEIGYERMRVVVARASGACEAVTYRARRDHVDPGLRPYRWYREIVLLGARFQRLPPSYVATIEGVAVQDDPDAARAAEAAVVIARLGAATA